MSDKQAAYQRDNQVLRGELRRQAAHHQKAIDAKNTLIEELRSQTPTGLRALYGSYQNLEPLLILLAWIRDLADPTKAHSIDGVKVTTSGHGSGIEGQGTKHDRDRLAKVNRWVNRWAAKLERELGVDWYEQPGESIVRGGPQCWRRQCEGRGRRQAWDQDICRFCEQPFTNYEPYFEERTG